MLDGFFSLLQQHSTIVLGIIVALVAWVDIKSLRIPISMLFITPILGLASLDWSDGYFAALERLALGLILFSILFGVNLAYFRLKGENGLGKHDPYYAAGLCIWIDPLYIPYAIIVACLVTLLLMTIDRTFFQQTRSEIPFAPGLGIGFCGILIVYSRCSMLLCI